MCSEELQYGLTMLEGQRDDLGKKVNMGAITEYRAKVRELGLRLGTAMYGYGQPLDNDPTIRIVSTYDTCVY